jgi:hypothetical protein
VAPTSTFIKVSGKCNAADCKYSWSRINAIEIEKIPDEVPKEAGT